ncbi:cobaltochelatase subunit CobN [Paenibacillus sp. TRM 82003]|nr:cobaltochelatase subunit CobN [Paenibacillus sp. TRM 82003]
MILYLTTTDTDILSLQGSLAHLPAGFAPLRAANLTEWLDDDATAAAFLDEHLESAKLVILRVLGGKKAHPYTFDRIEAHCRRLHVPMLAWSGDHEHYAELDGATNVSAALSQQALAYAVYGGIENFVQLLRFVSDTWLGTQYGCDKPVALPWYGIYARDRLQPIAPDEWRRRWDHGLQEKRPVVGVLFYRAHWLSRNVAFVDDLCDEIERQGAIPLPVFAQSLREDARQAAGESFAALLRDERGVPLVDALVVTMSFAVHSRESEACPPSRDARSLLETFDVPVFQALISLNGQRQWADSQAGLTPLDTTMNVALPEFDGRIITVPFSFKETIAEDPVLQASVRRYVSRPDRTEALTRIVVRWTRLKRKANREKKIAFVLNNSPSKNSRIGNGVGLDTMNSIVLTLRALADAGYDVGDRSRLPSNGDELAKAVIATCSNDRDVLTEEQLANAEGLSKSGYLEKWRTLTAETRERMEAAWGAPPGDIFAYGDRLIVPGVRYGNVFVGLQPPRGFGDNPSAIYHSPDLVPTHHYAAYYRWLRDEFEADAVIHLGKHGTLEWLPGKGVGLSEGCFPEIVLDDLPNFYAYIINNPGEGTQAKRRSHATIVDHMVPVQTTADTYGEMSRIELLLEEYYQLQQLDPKKLPYIQQEIWDTVRQAQLDQDLGQSEFPTEFEPFLKKIDGYICELKAAFIRDGLHVMGQVPKAAYVWVDLLYSLVYLPNGSTPSLPESVAGSVGLDWSKLQDDLGETWTGETPPLLAAAPDFPTAFAPRVRDLKEAVESIARAFLGRLVNELRLSVEELPDVDASLLPDPIGGDPAVRRSLDYVREFLAPRLLRMPEEIGNLLHGLDGGFVPPGPSGAPTRGMADILPTGRNFYSVDPVALPSATAWRVGRKLADELIDRYVREENTYPQTVAVVVWGTSAIRTRGDDVAQILALMGVRPVWEPFNGRVTGLETISLEELGRPRVDVTVRISGFFRDAFPHLVQLMNDAVEMVSALDEPPELNPLRKLVLEEAADKERLGLSPSEALATSKYRVFGSKPGTYGAGLLSLLDSGGWQTDDDIAEVFTNWSSYAYTNGQHGKPAAAEFRHRLSVAQIAAKNQDNREHDIFDSDEYYQEHGGLIASIRSLTGKEPKKYFGDSSNPSHVRVRDLSEEAKRVFRSRVINPKWLESVKRHGYKGALEMANTTDFLFGYDATAHVVEDWMYEKVSEHYVLDEAMRDFFRQSNPWALKDIAERLLEAAQRQLWEQPNPETIQGLMDVLLETEAYLEEGERPHVRS